MMGRQTTDQRALFYEFDLDERVPADHLLRRIDIFTTAALSDLHKELSAFYSHTGRPSIDPQLLIRMLIIGYCYGIRSERRLCEEVALNLAYRWFCRLDLDDDVPDHSTFSKNRHGRFRESDVLRHVFERVAFALLKAWSRARRLPLMPVSSRLPPAATVKKRPRRSTGAKSKSRREPCGNISMRLMKPVAWHQGARSRR
jgi:transposase